MKLFPIFCLALAVWPACCAGQTLSFTLTPQDFRSKKTKVKRTNLEYFSHYGLMLRDRSREGRLESESIEVPPGTLALLLQWSSSVPPDGLTIRVQVSNDGHTWSQWLVASEQAQLNPHNNLYFGKRVTGFGEARYVRYEAEILPQPPPTVPGTLALINIGSVTGSLPPIQNGRKFDCTINGGCREIQ